VLVSLPDKVISNILYFKCQVLLQLQS
jgi:hypothetical protein